MPSYQRTEGERLLALEDEVAKLKTALSRREPLDELSAGTFTIGADGVFKTSDFDGTDSTNPGTMGVYIASEAGVGKMVINDLVLRGGIIGNDALANPVAFASNGQASGNFAVPIAGATVVTQTLPVPAGFSRAVVMANGAINAFETNGSADYLYFTVRINGTGSSVIASVAGANSMATIANSSVRSLTGLSGGSITFTGYASTLGGNWAAQSSNACTINAIAYFLR